jgi:GH35 family endo-1,4-beta-xylanase
MIHGDYFAKRLGEGITREMFAWAAGGDPGARPYVNDYAILSGNDGPRYVANLRKLLDQGVPVGGIGCQGHFGKAVDGVHVRRTLDELAAFGLPIKITEYDADVADEEVKAACLETLYTVAFGHPSVEGILMWGFWEGAPWKPRAALWKRDFTPTPAAETYRRLRFKEWWTTASGTADASGRFESRPSSAAMPWNRVGGGSRGC